MGLDSNGIKFMLYAKSLGVNFSQIATIGRQYLYIKPTDFKEILVRFGYQSKDEDIEKIFEHDNGYAETFFNHIGAQIVDSFDYSDYEKATCIHDMNLPIPDFYKHKYDVVLDGGALEHVFNFPTAIKNCMEMTKLGGYFLGITPANNFMGHGFYQFSPELFFRIFTEENGYCLTRVIAFETSSKASWFAVKDPLELRERVTLINQLPVYLLLIAKRIAIKQIFQEVPQQSDYKLAWDDQLLASDDSLNRSAKSSYTKISLIKKYIPSSLKSKLRSMMPRKELVFDPKFFDEITLVE
jgi:hypothetical protein